MIDLFWQLNVENSTKWLLIVTIILCVCVTFVLMRKKKVVDSDEDYNEYSGKIIKTACHKNYMKCVEDNMKNGTNKFCFPCADDGSAADFIYDLKSGEMLKRD